MSGDVRVCCVSFTELFNSGILDGPFNECFTGRGFGLAWRNVGEKMGRERFQKFETAASTTLIVPTNDSVNYSTLEYDSAGTRSTQELNVPVLHTIDVVAIHGTITCLRGV